MENQQQVPSKKRVRFAQVKANDVHLIESTKGLSSEEIDNIWYSENDVCIFRDAARFMSRTVRSLKHDDMSKIKTESAFFPSENQTQHEFCTRGLEHRINLERGARKLIAIAIILSFHRKNRGDTQGLCLVAKKCAVWAKRMAVQDGTADAAAVARNYDAATNRSLASTKKHLFQQRCPHQKTTLTRRRRKAYIRVTFPAASRDLKRQRIK